VVIGHRGRGEGEEGGEIPFSAERSLVNRAEKFARIGFWWRAMGGGKEAGGVEGGRVSEPGGGCLGGGGYRAQ
jgi:hypothetical protein